MSRQINVKEKKYSSHSQMKIYLLMIKNMLTFTSQENHFPRLSFIHMSRSIQTVQSHDDFCFPQNFSTWMKSENHRAVTTSIYRSLYTEVKTVNIFYLRSINLQNVLLYKVNVF